MKQFIHLTLIASIVISIQSWLAPASQHPRISLFNGWDLSGWHVDVPETD